jgi:hypothetical protein
MLRALVQRSDDMPEQRMPEHGQGIAPDFTNAVITMLGVNLMWIFFVVWVLYGFVPVLVLAALVNHFTVRIAERRGLRPAFALARGKGQDVTPRQ